MTALGEEMSGIILRRWYRPTAVIEAQAYAILIFGNNYEADRADLMSICLENDSHVCSIAD